MNKKFVLIIFALVFFTKVFDYGILFANDGGQYYWGPKEINTKAEYKYTKADKGHIKVYKGVGKESGEFENIIIPSDVEVAIYADITDKKNINWSLIKFYYLNGFDRIGLIITEIPGKTYDETSDEDRIEYYNSLSEKDKYELLAYEYAYVNKDYGWVESKYLINKKEEDEAKNIINKNDEIKKEKEDLVDKETIAGKIREDTKEKKRSIFDIIKNFFIK